jgi:hypothetical protein
MLIKYAEEHSRGTLALKQNRANMTPQEIEDIIQGLNVLAAIYNSQKSPWAYPLEFLARLERL